MKYRLLIRRAAALSTALLLAAAPERSAALESELTAELQIPGGLESRLLVEAGGGRLLFVDLRDIRRPERDYAAAGFSSPNFTAGSVDVEGLLREISNPLGYGPSSSVFWEPNALSLRTNMERSSRFGLWTATPGNYFGVGGYVDAEDALHVMAALDWGGKSEPSFSAAVMASNPDAGPAADEWFPEKPSYPGGSLFHLAGRARAPFDSLTGAESWLGVSWGASRGKRTPPAAFVHAFGSYRSEEAEAYFLTGACGAGYATPSGAYPSLGRASSAALRLFPRGPLSARAAVSAESGRAESLPDRRPPEERRFDAGVGAKFKTLTFELDGGWRREKDSGGRETRSGSARAGVKHRGKLLWAGGAVSAGWENGRIESRKASLEAEYRPRGWEFSVRTTVELAADAEVSGKAEAAFVRPGTRVGAAAEFSKTVAPGEKGFSDLGANPFRYAVFSIYWRVRR